VTVAAADFPRPRHEMRVRDSVMTQLALRDLCRGQP
jgi:hypothetical protein